MAKRKKSVKRRAKAPQKRLLRKPLRKTWFQKLSDFFTKIFTAPSATAAKRRKAKTIREIKAHGYAPSYEKRLLRAVEAGKTPSLQRARGHAPGEAKRRAEREEAAQGITSAQIKSIRNFHQKNFEDRPKKFNNSDNPPDVEDMIEYAQENGYARFVEYRKLWTDLRRRYARELKDGTWSTRGLQELQNANLIITVPELEWYYYH